MKFVGYLLNKSYILSEHLLVVYNCALSEEKFYIVF